MQNILKTWWMTRSDAEQNFYLINTPVQMLLLLLLIPIVANQVPIFPFIFIWIALLFVIRWVIGTLTLWFDTENEKPLEIK